LFSPVNRAEESTSGVRTDLWQMLQTSSLRGLQVKPVVRRRRGLDRGQSNISESAV
jgi:hypothetical protein